MFQIPGMMDSNGIYVSYTDKKNQSKAKLKYGIPQNEGISSPLVYSYRVNHQSCVDEYSPITIFSPMFDRLDSKHLWESGHGQVGNMVLASCLPIQLLSASWLGAHNSGRIICFALTWEISQWGKEIDFPAPTQLTAHWFHAWWERARHTHALSYNRGPPLCLWRPIVSQKQTEDTKTVGEKL